MDVGSLGGIEKMFTFLFMNLGLVRDCKLWMNFELIVFQVGFDVSKNPEVIIIKKKDETIPCKILVRKSKNGYECTHTNMYQK
jgi:hypothetical protein